MIKKIKHLTVVFFGSLALVGLFGLEIANAGSKYCVNMNYYYDDENLNKLCSMDYSSIVNTVEKHCGPKNLDSIINELTEDIWLKKCLWEKIKEKIRKLDPITIDKSVTVQFIKGQFVELPTVDGDESDLKSALPARLLIKAVVPFDLSNFLGRNNGIFLYVAGSSQSGFFRSNEGFCSALDKNGMIECSYDITIDNFRDIEKESIRPKAMLFKIVAERIERKDIEDAVLSFNKKFFDRFGKDYLNVFIKSLESEHNIKINADLHDPQYLANFVLESATCTGKEDEDDDRISDDCDFDRNGNGIINHLEGEIKEETKRVTTSDYTSTSGGSREEIKEKSEEKTEEKTEEKPEETKKESTLKPSFSATAMDWRDELRGVYRIAQDSQVEKLVNEIVKKPSMLSLNLKASNDIDNDGVANDKDKCPNTAGNHPSGCKDSDGDSVIDSDDNCPAKYNPTQSDKDSDKIGDLCDSDSSAASEISKVNSTSSASGNSDGGGSCSILNKNESVHSSLAPFVIILMAILLRRRTASFQPPS